MAEVEARERALTWAAERLAAHARGVVLDLGCGEGRFLPPRGIGIDVDRSRLRSARTRSPYVALADAHALPFAEGTFDTVFANRMLNAAGRIDDVLAEAVRVLRADGQLLVLTLAVADPSKAGDRLTAENGEDRLRRHFARVMVERCSDAEVRPASLFRATHPLAAPRAAGRDREVTASTSMCPSSTSTCSWPVIAVGFNTLYPAAVR
ncbi:MAG: class I SAM-dependent methyltransferase [Chloroflexota bacterium]|nr:class I SAM-dependent methyltransferase [Chloroflexota bacterium]